MPKSVTIYHNPRCSKSRQTLELVRAQGVEPSVVEYLKTPLSAAKVKTLIAAVGGHAHDLLRPKEAAYKEHGLSKTSSAKTIAEAIAASPILLERPIVVVDKRAAIGRPPENVLPLLK